MGSEPSVPPRARWRDALVVAALAAALVLPPVGDRLIVTSHEARFALIAADMLERHVWFDAKVREQPYRNKPPLHPWSVVAGSYRAGHVTEWSARLPSAVATMATVLGAFFLADALFHRRAGLWAALVLLTCYGMLAHSQMILPDMPMIAAGVFAGYFFWRSVTRPEARWARVGFYAMLAIGVFAKGPAGLLPLAVAIAWLLLQEGPSGLRRLASLSGAIVFLALSLVWTVPFLTMGSDRFVGGVLWWDWLHYYMNFSRSRSLLSQTGELIVGFLPWTLLVPFAAVHAVRTRSEPAVRFAVLWFALQFVLIMASANQRVRYLLSLYPGLALLVAWWMTDDRRPPRRHRALAVVVAVALVALLAAVALHPLGHVVLRELPRHATLILAATGLTLVFAGFGLGFWLGRPGLLTTVVTAGMALGFAAGIGPYNDWVNTTRDFKALAATVERHAGGGPVGVFVSKGDYLQIDFYLGRHLKPMTVLDEFEFYLRGPGRPHVVMNQENWQYWGPKIRVPIVVVDTTFVGGEVMRLVRLAPSYPRPAPTPAAEGARR